MAAKKEEINTSPFWHWLNWRYFAKLIVFLLYILTFFPSLFYKRNWHPDPLYLLAIEDSSEFLWTARRSNQSILKEINPEYSLEGLMLKLKLQYFGHLMRSTDSLEKILMLRKTEGRRKRGWQRMRWLDGITDAMASKLPTVWGSSGSWWWTERPGVLQSKRLQKAGHNWTTEQQEQSIANICWDFDACQARGKCFTGMILSMHNLWRWEFSSTPFHR